jgi:phage replication initiation protein
MSRSAAGSADVGHTSDTAPIGAGRRVAEGRAPRTVIRGESPKSRAQTSAHGSAIIDYLRFTFLPPVSIYKSLEQIQQYMRLWFSAPINFVASDKGMFGYESSYDVMTWTSGEFVRIAIVCMGGGTAGGTMCVDMSGQGCSFVSDWRAVFATLQDVDARITRVDTALDLFKGFTLEQFDDLYFSGEFNCGGRIPSRRYVEGGNSHDPHSAGRTLYLGKKTNGKELCIYEKGKQLGDSQSEWLRIEIRFGNRDRVIPHDVLLDPTSYFAGGFVALRDLVDSLAKKIKCDQHELAVEERTIVLARLARCLTASYGKTIYQLAHELNYDYQALFDLLHLVGVPRRLEKSTVAGGMEQAHEPA